MALPAGLKIYKAKTSSSFVLVDGELKAELKEAYRYIDEPDEAQRQAKASPAMSPKPVQEIAQSLLQGSTFKNGVLLGTGPRHNSASSVTRFQELDLTEDLAMSDSAKEVPRALQRKEIKAEAGIQAGMYMYMVPYVML